MAPTLSARSVLGSDCEIAVQVSGGSAERGAGVVVCALLAELTAVDFWPREPRFDRLTDRAADVLDMPMLFVNLVHAERQWFKSTCGLDGVSDTPRDVGFCSHAIHEPELMLVPDASKDERFAFGTWKIEVLGAFALTEPAAGSDLAALRQLDIGQAQEDRDGVDRQTRQRALGDERRIVIEREKNVRGAC